MPPRPSTPRLGGVQEAQVVNAVFTQLEPAIGLMGWAFGMKPDAVAPLWMKPVQFIVRYAKNGHLSPGTSPEDIRSWIARLVLLMGVAQEDIWTMVIGPAFGAALARAHLAAGEPVPRQALAALGGVNERRIRQLVEAGDIEAPKAGDIPAVAAKAWLVTRKVVLTEYKPVVKQTVPKVSAALLEAYADLEE